MSKVGGRDKERRNYNAGLNTRDKERRND